MISKTRHLHSQPSTSATYLAQQPMPTDGWLSALLQGRSLSNIRVKIFKKAAPSMFAGASNVTVNNSNLNLMVAQNAPNGKNGTFVMLFRSLVDH